MTGWMPGVIHRGITPGSNDPAITPVGVVYHVAVSKSDSLHDYFDGPSGGIESHFYVRFDGTIEQYRSIFREADAQSAGNSFFRDGKRCGFVSVETEGMGEGRWTAAQIASLKRITLFVHSQSRFALRVCPGPTSPGVGYHRLYRAWNPNGHSCPGDARVVQFNQIIKPWLTAGASTQEDDVSAKEVWSGRDADQIPVPVNRLPKERREANPTFQARYALSEAWGNSLAAKRAAQAANARTKRIENALKALASGMSTTVKEAVEKALEDAVIDVDVDINHPGDDTTA